MRNVIGRLLIRLGLRIWTIGTKTVDERFRQQYVLNIRRGFKELKRRLDEVG